MPSFDRVRWLGAYLAITFVLPTAMGAARRMEFVRHALLVLAGSATILAIAMLAGLVIELVIGNRGSP
jgi:hypothetical protein